MRLRRALLAAGLSDDLASRVIEIFRPDATKRNPDPEYLGELTAGMSKRAIARTLDVRQSVLRDYLSGRVPCPYPVQHCLEILAESNIPANIEKRESEEPRD
jgi:hypothetical protein